MYSRSRLCPLPTVLTECHRSTHLIPIACLKVTPKDITRIKPHYRD